MNNQENIEILKDLGLSDQEIEVYISLLKTGGSDATSLSKQANIKRTTVYPILERLIKQNMVTAYEQGKKRFYSPIAPSRLASLFEMKIKNLFKVVPFLEKLKAENIKAYGIRMIQSKKDLRSFYTDILEEYKNKEYHIIGSTPTWLNTDKEFFIDYRKRRAMNNTKVRLLLSADSKKIIGLEDPSLLREHKYLPEKYVFKSTIDIFDDKIIIIGPSVDALAVVIEIPPMVDVFRSAFQILWDVLPSTN
jgi:sugar-specific transcriptional regulator TrmB